MGLQKENHMIARPRCDLVSALLVILPLLGGCSGGPEGQSASCASSGPASSDATDGGSSSDGAAAVLEPQDLAGMWRICSPSTWYYIHSGGLRLNVTAQGDTLNAYVATDDGGSELFLSGPIDMSTRAWSPDFYFGGGIIYKGDVHLVFGADGAHFTGEVTLPDDPNGTWYGAREDGAFTCGN
jgi:hypothetical protein